MDILLLGLLLIGVNLSLVSSLKCYSCNSRNEGEDDCVWIPEGSTKFLVECVAPKNKSCRIQEQWIDFPEDETDDKDKHMIRTCAATTYDVDNPCYYRTGFSGRTGVCFCLGDGCNHAVQTSSAVVITITFVLLVMIFT